MDEISFRNIEKVIEFLRKNFPIEYWKDLELKSPNPIYSTGLDIISYAELKELIKDENKVKKIINEIYNGKIFIIKKAFSKKFIETTKKNFFKFTSSQKSSFHKMVENCPDFHRVIDEKVSGNYSIKALKHSAYFFHWNGDKYKMFDEINERWRILKFLGGKKFDQYEKNTPKDGVVDRIQVLKYPPGGSLGTHYDPNHNQRFFISIYASKREKMGDYESGGFYTIDKDNKKIDIESYIDVGDIGFGYATIRHGVSKIDDKKTCDWQTKSGRWFIGLYSNDSDEKINRVTATSLS